MMQACAAHAVWLCSAVVVVCSPRAAAAGARRRPRRRHHRRPPDRRPSAATTTPTTVAPGTSTTTAAVVTSTTATAACPQLGGSDQPRSRRRRRQASALLTTVTVTSARCTDQVIFGFLAKSGGTPELQRRVQARAVHARTRRASRCGRRHRVRRRALYPGLRLRLRDRTHHVHRPEAHHSVGAPLRPRVVEDRRLRRRR